MVLPVEEGYNVNDEKNGQEAIIYAPDQDFLIDGGVYSRRRRMLTGG